MFNIFTQSPKKKFNVYDNGLKPCYEARVNNLEDERDELQEKVDELTDELEEAKKEIEDLQANQK